MDKFKKRGNVIREILETEELYVQGLQVVIELYLNPLLKNGLISKPDVEMIFSNIDEIKNVNDKFLEGLKNALGPGPDYSQAVVGYAFLDIIPFFKLYTVYVNNQEISGKTLQTQTKSSSVRKFLKVNEDNERSQGLDLESLLITPVQRIPRYKLLLESLLKYTPPEHPDSQLVQKALVQVGAIANEINKAAREAADYLALIDIQKQFKDGVKSGIAVFGRRLIKKGPLTKVCRSKDQEYTFFLFNDMLLYAHGGSGASVYVIHVKIPVNRKFNVRDIPDSDQQKNRIEILSVAKSFTVYATNPGIKADWIKTLKELISKIDDEISFNPVDLDINMDDDDADILPTWNPDQSSSVCSRCFADFSLIRRRHHCRKCGDLVCGPCSRNKIILKKNYGGAPVRVCDKCFISYTTDITAPSGVVINDGDLKEYAQNNLVAMQFKKPLTNPLEPVVFSSPTSYSSVPDIKADCDPDSDDELGNKDSWYEAIQGYSGNAETQEMSLRKGNRLSVQYRDPSGFWFGINLASHEIGWVDPYMLRQIVVSTDQQQRDLEDALRISIAHNETTPESKPDALESTNSTMSSGSPMTSNLYIKREEVGKSDTASIKSTSTASSKSNKPSSVSNSTVSSSVNRRNSPTPLKSTGSSSSISGNEFTKSASGLLKTVESSSSSVRSTSTRSMTGAAGPSSTTEPVSSSDSNKSNRGQSYLSNEPTKFGSKSKPNAVSRAASTASNVVVEPPKVLQLYKVVVAQDGNEQTEELKLVVGDVILISQMHESGFWFGKSKKTGKTGWLDPSCLQPI